MAGIRPKKHYPKWSFAYRIQRLSRALGWSYEKIAEVAGIGYAVIWHHMKQVYGYNSKRVVLPRLKYVQRMLAIEETYAVDIKRYNKYPRKMDRSRGSSNKGKKRYKPLPVVAIGDPHSLDVLAAYRRAEVEARKPKMDDAAKERKSLDYGRRGQTRARTWVKMRAQGWDWYASRGKVRPGRPNNQGGNETEVDSGVRKTET